MNNRIQTIGRGFLNVRRRKYLIGGAIVLILLILLFSNLQGERYCIRTFPMMGTVGRITLYSDQVDLSEKAMDQAQKMIGAIEKVCNIFHPESELSRLNRTAYGREFSCSPLLWEMLCAADHHYKLSGGVYDPTVQPLMSLWGFRRKRKTLPDTEEIKAAMKKVGWSKVRLNPEKQTVRFLEPGVGIDLGGIAKGFALDKVKIILIENGIRRAVLDFGGNIGCLTPDRQDPFRIGIRNPENPGELLESVKVCNQCVATSGNYERYVVIDGKQYTHIMDPRSGVPVAGMLSVTVVTPGGTDSDAVSTAVFVAGPAFAEKVCRTLPDTGILMVRRDPANSAVCEIRRFGSLAR